jgi:23S rRNA (cytosine1962-C5)-methyltransferase
MSAHISKKESSYELLDSGSGMKLERFGAFTLARPDPEALWQKQLPESSWKAANATFERKGATGAWKKDATLPKAWTISYGGLSLELRPTSFKHVGLFPEQKEHWDWMTKKLTAAKGERPLKVLNLFAYTGAATLAAAQIGAEVVHLDSSKVAIEWARKNAELSGLSVAPIRWIEDDALKFLRKELKRGNRYDAIIMDPPAFGHGSGSTLWKIERDFYELIELSLQVLSDTPVALILNGYTAGYSPLTLKNNLISLTAKHGGVLECGELAISEGDGERLLPAGVFARWSAQ